MLPSYRFLAQNSLLRLVLSLDQSPIFFLPAPLRRTMSTRYDPLGEAST
jgi:hypothetical protein